MNRIARKNGSLSTQALLLALAMGATLVGCGGGGGGGGNSTNPPTNSAPVIKTQPASTAALDGSPVTLSVAATGSGTLTYQWKKNGTAIAGATGASYTIDAVNAGTTGSYTVDVTNEFGTTTSAIASVRTAVATAPRITTQPQSHGAELGSSTVFNVTVSGTGTIAYQWKKDGVEIPGATSSTLTISPVVASSAGSYSVTATNSLGTTTSSAATLTISSAPAITSQPSSQTVNANGSATFTVVATGTAPLTYQWTKLTGNNTGVIAGATGPSLTINPATASSAGTYRVTVTNAFGSATSNVVTLTVILPPTITTQPSSLTVGVGSAASFTVAVTGTGTPTFQWYKNNVAISGARSSTYPIAATVAGDAATYKVVVTNSAGSTTSNSATLVVDQPPTITTQPTSLTVTAGQPATFSVTATASGTLTFQWYRNGAIIANANASAYTLATTAASDSGASFKVVVSNDGVISRESAAATLTVNP